MVRFSTAATDTEPVTFGLMHSTHLGIDNNLLSTLDSRLLAGLPIVVKERSRLDVVFEVGDSPDHIYFPNPGCVVSLLRPTLDGEAIEVGICGSEGFFSIRSFLNPGREITEAIVQAEGTYCAIETRALRGMCARVPALREAMLTYVSTFVDQLTQHAVCNRLHSLEQRLIKWLLLMRDRIGSNEVNMTHELIAGMLGVRRSGITEEIATLEHAGLIWHSRRLVSIRDADGLQRLTCECYHVLHANFFAAAGGEAAGARLR